MREKPAALPSFGWKGLLLAAAAYLLYTVALPVLTELAASWLSSVWGVSLTARAVMLIPYYASFLITAFMFRGFLTDGARVFFSRFLRSAGAMLAGIAIYIAVTLVLSALLGFFEEEAVTNPNDAVIDTAFDRYRSEVIVMAVLLGPLVEEVIFRGAVFGSLWNKNKVLAYAVSWLLFGMAHVGTYAETYSGWNLPIYLAQYLPFSIAAAWSYARSGSIWAPVFMHMAANALSFL